MVYQLPPQGLEEKTPLPDAQCSICLTLFADEQPDKQDKIVGHSAQDVFHRDCIRQWLQVQNTCPLCRRYIYFIPSHREREARLDELGPLASVIEAIRRGRPAAIIEALLDASHLSEHDLELAVIDAVHENCSPEVLRKLLAPGKTISPHARALAINAAIRQHRLDLLQRLYPKKISDRDRGTAVYLATQIGDLFIVETLLNSGPIPDKDREDALTIARSSDRPDIEAALLNKRASSYELFAYAVIGIVTMALSFLSF